MITSRLAIIGFGNLGKACARAIALDEQSSLVGIVRRANRVTEKLGEPFHDIPVVTHIKELTGVDAALICVPTKHTLVVAQELLQSGVPVVECATLHDKAFETHKQTLDRYASRYKVPAVVGAGWDPGALSLFRNFFALLTPKGHTEITHRPGISLHHTTLAQAIPGIKDALSTELRNKDGDVQRYVYVELEEGAELAQVEQAIRSDPLFLNEETLVFPMDSLAALEDEGHGVLIERRGAAGGTEHQLFLLEARCSELALAAQIMLAAARTLSTRGLKAYTLFDLPPAALWGQLRQSAEQEWI